MDKIILMEVPIKCEKVSWTEAQELIEALYEKQKL